MNILIINGPNLNLLGLREPEIYQNNRYQDLLDYLNQLAIKLQIQIKVFQSNYEGAIIDCIHQALHENIDGIVINPAAYTHYSYAIHDALKAVNLPAIEVHLTDITKREDWRKISVISDACIKTFYGEHFLSYQKAIEYLIKELKNHEQ